MLLSKANDEEVGFEDYDLDFGANLVMFGVSVPQLKSPHEENRRFEEWITEEDLERWKHNHEVAEEYLLQKVKGLWFYFPGKYTGYKVWDKILIGRERMGG